MKRLLVLFLLTPIMMLKAQIISVTEFYQDPSDLTANTAGTIVMDQNGRKCALIKIETTQKGFSFDAGKLGIVKTEQKVGEIWVYVPEGVKRFSMSHSKLGVLRDYDLGETLKRARTYIMRLNTGDPVSLGQAVEAQYILFRLTPQNAIVILDGDTLFTKNGTAEIMKNYGTYDYRVEALNYVAEVGKVTIDEQSKNKSLDIKLKSELGGEDESILTFNVGNATFNMVFVEGGTFMMGGDNNSDSGSRGTHQVTVSPYYIGETEVTKQLWTEVMGKTDKSSSDNDFLPVADISWNDCQDFIAVLNRKTGRTFRLPTEAEWEYAARGGSKSRHYKYSGSNNLQSVGWYNDNNTSHGLNKVKSKQGNELGIYDMSGNVSEWCSDWFGNYPHSPQIDPLGPVQGSQRVMRGGNIIYEMEQCGVSFRSANLTSRDPDYYSTISGLRLVLK